MTSTPADQAEPAALPGDLAEALDRARPALGRFASPLLFFSSIGSTNDYAVRLAEAGAPEGATVVADTQRAGRGRLGRHWFSPPGAGLYVSIVFRADAGKVREDRVGPSLPSVLTVLSGVALAEAIRETTGLPVVIKWPNDIVHDGRKLAGILAEASAQGSVLDYVILGFGINVRAVTFPQDIAGRASTLETELGRHVDRGALLARALVKLGQSREALRRGEIGGYLSRWRRLSPSSLGRPVAWRGADGLRRGRTAGLDRDGALLVDVGGGIERVLAGEVIWE